MDDCAELQNALLATRTIEDFVRELPRIAVRHVAEGASCGMTLRPDGRPATAAATDPVTAGVDEMQYRLDDGPCLQAMRGGEVVTIDDTAWSTRWPEFEAQAAAAGIRSCLAVPVQAAPRAVEPPTAPRTDPDKKVAIGVLTLYARETAAFGDEQARRAEEFAEKASGALAIAERLASYADLNQQLRASLASRPVIDQALGIIIAREKCSQSAAFAILRNASQNSNTKIRDLAARVVTEVTGEPVQPPSFVMPGVSAAPVDPSAEPTFG
jgi:GAF domain-containing protein